jgi:hypothetical protein
MSRPYLLYRRCLHHVSLILMAAVTQYRQRCENVQYIIMIFNYILLFFFLVYAMFRNLFLNLFSFFWNFWCQQSLCLSRLPNILIIQSANLLILKRIVIFNKYNIKFRYNLIYINENFRMHYYRLFGPTTLIFFFLNYK